MQDNDSRSIAEIISAVTGDLANLVRKESELVRTEVTEKISDAAKAGGTLSIGAALLLGGFLTLMAALVIVLDKFMDLAWAAVVVGVGASLIGFTLVRGAAKKMQPSALSPDRSSRQIQKDAEFVKEQVR